MIIKRKKLKTKTDFLEELKIINMTLQGSLIIVLVVYGKFLEMLASIF